MSHGRTTLFFTVSLASVAVLFITPFIGMHGITPAALLHGGDPLIEQIFWSLRVPRAVAAYAAGAGLALAGLVFQAMFRNPLATPYTLGVASGASFGAAVAFRFIPGVMLLGISSLSWAAFAGAILAVALVYGVARVAGAWSLGTLLMAGVAASFCFTSLVVFIQYLSDFTTSFRLVRWLMGGLETVDTQAAFWLTPVVLTCACIFLALRHELNLLITGEEMARSRGLPVERTRKILFAVSSWMVATIVVYCGPIGFIGIMVPHAARFLVGYDHRRLVPACFLLGGAF